MDKPLTDLMGITSIKHRHTSIQTIVILKIPCAPYNHHSSVVSYMYLWLLLVSGECITTTSKHPLREQGNQTIIKHLFTLCKTKAGRIRTWWLISLAIPPRIIFIHRKHVWLQTTNESLTLLMELSSNWKLRPALITRKCFWHKTITVFRDATPSFNFQMKILIPH